MLAYLPSEIRLFPAFLPRRVADELLHHSIQELPWAVEKIPMFGKIYDSPRVSCAIAEPGVVYTYRGSHSTTTPFTRKLTRLRHHLEKELKQPFNYILATRYRNGRDHLGWHSDDERDLGDYPTIASLSLGATRIFRFRKKSSNETISLQLNHRDLLLMSGDSQKHYKHTLPPSRNTTTERVNLSFRYIRD